MATKRTRKKPPRTSDAAAASVEAVIDEPQAGASEKRAGRPTTAVGAPANDKMEARARRIIATATELAEEGGFEAVRLRDVAAHAKVALGTLYRRFRSKEDLLMAAMEAEIEQLERRLDERPARGETRLARLSHFFETATFVLVRRPKLARAVLRAVASAEPGITRRVAGFHTRMKGLIVSALRGGESPGPATEQEEALALVLQNVWFSALVGWAGGIHDETEVTEQLETAARLCLFGLEELAARNRPRR